MSGSNNTTTKNESKDNYNYYENKSTICLPPINSILQMQITSN